MFRRVRSHSCLHHFFCGVLSCTLRGVTISPAEASPSLVVSSSANPILIGSGVIGLLILLHDPFPALIGMGVVLCGDFLRRYFFPNAQLASVPAIETTIPS